MGYIQKKNLPAKKCYELLQNSSLPCTICNNDELQEGQFKEWRYFNPLLNKYFKIKDTVVEDNGRRYRIEIALNISSQEHQKNVVRRYEKLEKSLMRDCVLPLEHLLRINRWTSFWNI